MTNEELKHVGILGMHWGKRKAKPLIKPHSDQSTADKIRQKDIREMSNEDLKTLTARIQLEKQYKDVSKKQVGKGKLFAQNFIETFAKQQLNTLLGSLAVKGIAAVGTGAAAVVVSQVLNPARKIGF